MSETPQETLEQWLGLTDRYPHPTPEHIRESIRAVLGDLVEAEQTSRADEERIAHLEAERDALRAEIARRDHDAHVTALPPATEPCPKCGKPSRLTTGAGGPCLSCTMDTSPEVP